MADVCPNVTVELDNRPDFIAINAFFLYFTVGFCLFCILVWLSLKGKYERTKIRPTGLVVMACTGCFVNTLLVHLSVVMQKPLPCWLLAILLTIIVPLVAGSLIARLIAFYFLSLYSAEAAQSATTAKLKSGFAFDTPGSTFGNKNACQHFIVVFRLGYEAVFRRSVPNGNNDENHRTDKLQSLRFMVSTQGVSAMVLALIIPFLIVSFVIIVANQQVLVCGNCTYIRSITIYTMVVVGIVVIIFGIVAWLKVRSLTDQWGLRAESFYSLILSISAMVWFLAEAFGYLGPPSLFQFSYLISLSLLAMVCENSLVQIWLARRENKRLTNFQRTTQRTSLYSHSASLEQILSDKELSAAFEQHLIDEFGIESLLFLRDAQDWRLSYFDVALTARKVRAKKICLTYIRANGLYAVNLPAAITSAISRRLDNEQEEPQVALFDDAITEVKTLLTKGAVIRFTKSKRYHEFQSSSIKAGQVAPVM
jgi:hypothetical protein